MKWLHAARLRLRALRRSRLDRELHDELQFHLDMAALEKIGAGADPAQARHEASLELGNPTSLKERSREMFSFTRIESILQDVRYATRELRGSPGFTAVAALSLALGIGANTAIFSVTDALMLRKLPVRSPEQLVELTQESTISVNFVPYPMFERFRKLTEVFHDSTGISGPARFGVSLNGVSEDASVSLVSGTYFSTFGVETILGRPFTPDDDRTPGGHTVAVISDRYWERRFGRAPDVLGRVLTLNGTAFSILGVASPGFAGDMIGAPTDLWIPIAMQSLLMPDRPGLLTNRNSNWVRIIARLQPGATIEQTQAVGEVIYRRLLAEGMGSSRLARSHLGVRAAGRGWAPQREFFSRPLVILTIVVGLVLLIACANIASLLLARSTARQREMAVRAALGAGRWRIARQSLIESLLLAVAGTVLGLVFASWGTSILLKFLASSRMAFDLDLHPDARVLAFTGALCLLTAALFGVAPASRGSRLALSPALGGRGAISGPRFRLGKLLVVSQVALSLLLLIGAGLFARTLRNLNSQDLGLDRDRVLLIWTAPDRARRGASLANLFDSVQERIASMPGVLQVSATDHCLLSGFVGVRPVTAEGYQPKADEEPNAQWSLVGPGFFHTVGLSLLAGRDFTERDTESSPRVGVINETMARYFFGGQNPIGKRFGMSREEGYPIEVVGVVRDSKYTTLRDSDVRMFYLPYRQDIAHLNTLCVAARTPGDVRGVAGRIRDELRTVDPSLRVLRIDTVQEQIDRTLAEERMVAMLSGFFGALSALLACLGLYGVMSYTTARRTSEIGIRLALGATRPALLNMVLKESMALALAGIAIGLPAALALSRLIRNQLFGIASWDPLTVTLAVIMMMVVAALAALIPARRAATVDPMIALRYE
jgi:predicted permease